jgi:acyl-CoA thioester hydrolase
LKRSSNGTVAVERATSVSIEPPVRPSDSHVSACYRYVRPIQVRFRDLDVLGHVNHVVYLSYVEQVRSQYFFDLFNLNVPGGLPYAWVVARATCEYLLPLGFGEVVEVGWRITRLGGASADYLFELVRGNDLVARGSGVLVLADPLAGKSAPIPDDWRAAIAAFEGIAARSPQPS